MKKILRYTSLLLLIFSTVIVNAQTREELEKQKLQLKKELQETEKMLTDNKSKTKENLLQWRLITDKVNIQDKIINNINSDINLLDNNIYAIQRDINKYDKLLDTLKLEYAKSMVYAYKNRSNYDFLNFIFSASTFNDAIKRVAYLKSYRNYREMQGQNIIRTQELRKQRIEELTGTKQKKNIVLQSKDKEMQSLEDQQNEKDRIVAELKKQGKNLNAKYAANVAKMRKVENAIAANIRKILEEKKKADAIAKAAAKKKADEEALAAAALKKKTDANNTNANNTNANVKKTDKPVKVEKPGKDVTSLPDENKAISASFISNKGNLPWPVNGRILFHFGTNILPPNNTKVVYNCVSIATEVGATVKTIFSGEVTLVDNEDGGTVMIQHGNYFSTYTNLSNVTVSKGQKVTMGQVIGKAMANLDGIGYTDLYLYDDKSRYYDPEVWLR